MSFFLSHFFHKSDAYNFFNYLTWYEVISRDQSDNVLYRLSCEGLLLLTKLAIWLSVRLRN